MEPQNAAAWGELGQLTPRLNLSHAFDCQEEAVTSGAYSLETARTQLATSRVGPEVAAHVDHGRCLGLAPARTYSDFDAVEPRMASGTDSLASVRQGLATARREAQREARAGGGGHRPAVAGWGAARGSNGGGHSAGCASSSSSESETASDDDEFYTADFSAPFGAVEEPPPLWGEPEEPWSPGAENDENHVLEQRMNALLAKSGALSLICLSVEPPEKVARAILLRVTCRPAFCFLQKYVFSNVFFFFARGAQATTLAPTSLR
jgi:hypothetical protein